MTSLVPLAQALGLAYASGISLYATVALLGVAERLELVTGLPPSVEVLRAPWIIGLALVLAAVEFVATLVPGLAAAWDAVHSLLRPPAAAAMAVLVAWNGDPALILAAGLLGGTLGIAVHATKLGVRVAIDTSPEPVTNATANVAELATIALVVSFVWRHPVLTLTAAGLTLAGVMYFVRTAWRTLRTVGRSIG